MMVEEGLNHLLRECGRLHETAARELAAPSLFGEEFFNGGKYYSRIYLLVLGYNNQGLVVANSLNKELQDSNLGYL